MSLDLAPLARAVGELQIFLGLCEAEAAGNGQKGSAELRAFQAASIQAFEFTFELCHKMMRRYLDAIEPSATPAASLTFPDLVRQAHARGLIPSGWREWARFREMRNMTSHTYDPGKAAGVVAALPSFLAEARALLERMQAVPAP